MDIEEVRRSYDAVAREYRLRLAAELEHKPFDIRWLRDFAARVGTGVPVLEVGCGDGHIAAFLAAEGIDVQGLDLSPGMVAVANESNPSLRFSVGDVRSLTLPSASLSGLVSFYSIVNLDIDDCRAAFRSMHRCLERGGIATLAFHTFDLERGAPVRRMERWWDTDASLDFYFHSLEVVTSALEAAGFEIVRAETRPPYAPDVEAQTTRGYVLARKP